MASLTIRNFDDQLKSMLRVLAASHGCSMEQEARDILSKALQPQTSGAEFAQRINQRFAGLEVDALPIPPRRPARMSVIFDAQAKRP